MKLGMVRVTAALSLSQVRPLPRAGLGPSRKMTSYESLKTSYREVARSDMADIVDQR